ncbi:MAG: hypothetical protein F6K19_47085 [Cyanothece sp. SIO1E1]|nr:hypothetical protein [Cyanothece sp. SIO1E1]
MNWFKSPPTRFTQATHRWGRAIAALLIPMAALSIGLKIEANNPSSAPTTAIVQAWNGYISMRRGQGQASRVDHKVTLAANVDVLEVPGSRGGTEHWAHLQFRQAGKFMYPLVQAGTDAAFTQYRFPCAMTGSGVIAWGLRSRGRNACKQITTGSTAWQSALERSRVAQKSSVQQPQQSTGTQSDASALTVSSTGGSSLIYIQDLSGGVAVNVLTGRVSIQAAASPRKYIVRAGVRYTDYGNSTGGNTTPVPDDVYTSRPVRIFLDPAHWPQDIHWQLQAFEDAIDQQIAPPPPSSDPTRPIPEPTQPDPPTPPPAQNRDPQARGDQITTINGQSQTINVLRNDSDPDGDRLTVIRVTQPRNGSIQWAANGSVTYIPNQGFYGRDRFQYTVSDGQGGESTAIIAVDSQSQSILQ